MSESVTPQLADPAYLTHPPYTQTLGPEVADLADLAGFAPDPEQRLVLDLIFALDSKGKSAAFEVATIVARQNLKTGVFKQAALGWLFITDQQLVTWSAHEFSTTKEALRDLAVLIEGSPYLSRRLKSVRYANDDPSIELMTGQRIKFKARTRSGGRGLTGDKVVLDEAFALTDDHMGSLLPTLSVVPDPQLLYGSSGGLSTSYVLRGIRDRGRAGTSDRLAYVEWCAERVGCENSGCSHEPGSDGCALDREDLWHQANPLLGRPPRANGTALTIEYLRSERQALPPSEFARERLTWWDDPTGADLFGVGAWESCETEDDPSTSTGGLALAVSYDLAWACFGGAAKDGDRVHVRPLRHGPGTGWVVDAALELQAKTSLAVVVDERGPASDLIQPLRDAGVHVRTVDTGEVLDSCQLVRKLVADRLLAHQGYAELDAAVGAAVWRTVGERQALGRKQSDGDISPLEACTLAAWAARWPQQSAYEDDDADLLVV